MRDNFRKIFQLFTSSERRRALTLFILVLFMALFDMIGVASIMPFLAVLSDPTIIERNAILNSIYAFFSFTDPNQFLFTIGVFAFLLLLFSLAFKALTTYLQLRFSMMIEASLSKRLLDGYLNQPYSWFLGRNSSELAKTILSEVSVITHGSLVPSMNLFAHGAVILGLVTLLIFSDPLLAIIVAFVLGGTYFIIYYFTNGYLSKIGKERLHANEMRYKTVSEALGASKEVKLGSLEDIYVNRFAIPANQFAKNSASAGIIAHLPRFALEAIAFGGMMLVILYLMVQSGDLAEAIPIIGLYAFAGYRLMPALQNVYAAGSQLKFTGPSLDAVVDNLSNLKKKHLEPNDEKLVLHDKIELIDISFNYPDSDKSALENVSMTIPAMSVIGVVGSTGSGKTTLIDVILGLLVPQSGYLKVDGNDVNDSNFRAWQYSLGYVPQQIYLSDDTVSANIAFGVDPENIDHEALIKSAKIANLHDFIINDMQNGYETIVGERGVRLSGGQRQRIGIARSLYHSPNLLIFDEATSALDNLTEQAVMEAINNLKDEITIILIAHRLSTVKECDQIFLLEQGRITAHGKYDELIEKSEKFKSMTLTLDENKR